MVEIQSSETRAFYSFQNFMQNVHSETYSLLIDTYIKDSDEKCRNVIQYYPCIKKKTDWAVKWIGDESSSFRVVMVVSVPLHQIHFSNNDFLGFRIRFIGIRVLLRRMLVFYVLWGE